MTYSYADLWADDAARRAARRIIYPTAEELRVYLEWLDGLGNGQPAPEDSKGKEDEQC